jgi:hypothetical protein
MAAAPPDPGARVTLLAAALLLLPAASLADSPPDAREGFQMHLGMGATVPAGRATGAPGDDLAARYSWQFLLLDLGLRAKVTDATYVGGYFALGLGVEGSDPRVERACDDNDQTLDNEISCSAASVRLGVEMRHSFGPDQEFNPWIGYGIGMSMAQQGIADKVRGRQEDTTLSGIDWARLSTGLDVRMGKVSGLGPALTVGLGRYDHTSTTVNGDETFDGSVEDKSFHAWVSLTLRWVVLP